MDSLALLRRLGDGEEPSALGVPRMEDGFLDLRRLRIPRPKALAYVKTALGTAAYVGERVTFQNSQLNRIDLSGCMIVGSCWERFTFRDARFDGAHARDVVFRSGEMSRVSLRRADLRGSHWGGRAPGPMVSDVDFTETKLNGTTFSQPLFRGCSFVDVKKGYLDFSAARFERCTFRGPLGWVSFFGSLPGRPDARELRNEMRDVDFSGADLRSAEFLGGCDMASCKLPSEGILRIPRPKECLLQVLLEVRTDWSEKERDIALKYLNFILDKHVRDGQRLYVVGAEVIGKIHLGRDRESREAGRRLVRVLERYTE